MLGLPKVLGPQASCGLAEGKLAWGGVEWDGELQPMCQSCRKGCVSFLLFHVQDLVTEKLCFGSGLLI